MKKIISIIEEIREEMNNNFELVIERLDFVKKRLNKIENRIRDKERVIRKIGK